MFSIMMLEKNSLVTEAECKSLIAAEMLYGKVKMDYQPLPSDRIISEINSFRMSNDMFKKLISIYKITKKLKRSKKPSCPFYESEISEDWIENLLNLLEENFLPALQKV